MNDKWLSVNEEVAHKKIISCTKVTELKNLGKFLYKLKCRLVNQVKKAVCKV